MTLDNPEKTGRLLLELKAAVPFEVTLTPELIAELGRGDPPIVVGPIGSVSDISYAGDEGGIMCHLSPAGEDRQLVVSLTHLRASRTLPFAAAAIAYQKHRQKKIRKLLGEG